MSNIEELTKKDVELNRNEIYRSALEMFGVDSQLDVAIEEMSELIKEIIKFKRGKGDFAKIAEEAADVWIMLEQIIQVFNIEDLTVDLKIYKLNRLMNYINDLKGKKNEK